MTAAPQDAFVRAVDTSPVYALARETALQHAPGLSIDGAPDVWLKREDQQPWFSFKIRGAVHAVAALAPELRQRGVVAASAGNHAQGLAAAARHFGVTASIVMPRATPAIKVAAVRALGAQVRLVGDTFADADRTAAQLAATRGLTLVHPFDDPRVIEGQATIAAEILRQHAGPIEAIVVPVGALGVAGLGRLAASRRGPVVAVLTGANVDFDRLAEVARRSAPRGGRATDAHRGQRRVREAAAVSCAR